MSKQDNQSRPKVGDGTPDAALAIGEDALRAGVKFAFERLKTMGCDISMDDLATTQQQAWGDYEPPEHIKELS